MLAAFKHPPWQDLDGVVDEDVRHIPRHHAAQRVDEPVRVSRVLLAPFVGYGGSGRRSVRDERILELRGKRVRVVRVEDFIVLTCAWSSMVAWVPLLMLIVFVFFGDGGRGKTESVT